MAKYGRALSEDDNVGWVFRLWRPFLALRVTRNPANNLLRFEPAFYAEITKLPRDVLERILLETAKEGVEWIERTFNRRDTLSMEIVVRDGVVPPSPMLLHAGHFPAVISLAPGEQFLGELEYRKADSEHPFWRVYQITDRGARPAPQNHPRVSEMERQWMIDGPSGRELIARIYDVPAEWVDAE